MYFCVYPVFQWGYIVKKMSKVGGSENWGWGGWGGVVARGMAKKGGVAIYIYFIIYHDLQLTLKPR